MLRDFRAFILRGNVIDLAIGVAIGAAFTGVVGAFTTGIVTPILAIPGDKPSFAAYTLDIGGSEFLYGALIDAIIQFLIIAAVLFFFVVVPVNKLMQRRRTETEVEMTTKDCPHCISSIPMAATRCAFCTSEVAA